MINDKKQKIKINRNQNEDDFIFPFWKENIEKKISPIIESKNDQENLEILCEKVNSENEK